MNIAIMHDYVKKLNKTYMWIFRENSYEVIYIYIYIERERERERESYTMCNLTKVTPFLDNRFLIDLIVKKNKKKTH